MDPILATININIGLGKDNPTLVIKANDNISNLIEKLIIDYQLPKKVHSIIMERVQRELPQTPVTKTRTKETSARTTFAEKKTSTSPQPQSNLSTAKLVTKKPIVAQKQNNSLTTNCLNQTAKYAIKKSISPAKRVDKVITLKKIDKIPYKSPIKQNSSENRSLKVSKIGEITSKIQKLFKYLIKENPRGVKAISTQFINLKNLDKNLLNDLQCFFEKLQEEDFDRLDENYFTQKVEQLGFKSKFQRKQYDYCYSN